MNIREMTKEQLAEESSIDIAYNVLAEKGEPLTLRQLMDEVRKLNGVTVRAMAEKLNQVNTDINIDGRFLAIDDIRWGLREWYPVDQLEAETAPVVRARKKSKDDEEDEDEDEIDEDGFDKIDFEDEDDDEEEEADDGEETLEEDEDELEIDEDLLVEEDDEMIPDDVEFEEEEEEDEDEYEEE